MPLIKEIGGGEIMKRVFAFENEKELYELQEIGAQLFKRLES